MKKTGILVLAVLVLAACGGSETKKSNAGGGEGRDRLVIALQSSPTNLDSRVGNDNASGRLFDLVHSGLIRNTPEMEYAPDVAERWETPDDRTIIFHLNPNAKFHDGRTITAQDVKWTYESMLAESFTSAKKAGYAVVDRIEAPDAKTVIFRLKEPNGGMFDNLTVGIQPQGSDTNVFKTKPIGAGPYKVVEFRTDEHIELAAFDQWHLGAPKIKRITVRIVPDDTTRVLEMRRGSIDLETNAIPFENVAEFEKSPIHQVVKKPGAVWQYIAFNLKDPIFSKLKVRQALAHAIDRQKIVTDLLRGHGVPADTMLAQGHWARAEGLPAYPFDQQRAKQLLDEAGYRDPDGAGPRPRFSFTFKSSTNAEANLRAEMIQQMLSEVGVEMKIQTNELGTFLEDIGKGNFQMYSLSRNGILDPDFYYIIFHSANFPPEGQNRGYYSNPKVDQLITQGRSTFDRAKRKEIYGQIQRIAQEDLPYISLYHQTNVAVMDKDLTGYAMYPSGFWLSVANMARE